MIAVENGEPESAAIIELVQLHRSQVVDVGITTVSASESLSGSKRFPASALLFIERLNKLGWQDLTWVLGPGISSLSYIGFSKIVGESFTIERDAIWGIIGGKQQQALPSDLPEEKLHSAEYSGWRNVWCDVHTLWAHIDAKRDVFVTTNTKDFQNKAVQLKNVGLRSAMKPSEVLEGLS